VNTFPTKDDMADYLEQYAARFQLPVRSATRVTEVINAGETFAVQTDHGPYLADRVVIATGASQHPRIPPFAADLDPSIRQFHSADYHLPAQFADGDVLVVGAGNSGTDIALEAARTHRTYLAGRHPGQVPIDIDSRWARPIIPLAMFAFKHVLTLRTPMGRAKRADLRNNGVPLTRNKLKQLDAAGISRVGRIIGTRDGRPLTVNGVVLDVPTVVWCTGYRTDYPWLRLPDIGDDGRPRHHRGIVDTHPGLYFIGLEFQFALASATLHGLDRDTRYIVRQITQQRRSPTPHPAAPTAVAEK
jgi:putative flavoprotein involved in K+ transport